MKYIFAFIFILVFHAAFAQQDENDYKIKFFNALSDTLSKDPHNPNILFTRALGYFEEKEYAKSVRDLNLSILYFNDYKKKGIRLNQPDGPLDSIDILHLRASCNDRLDSVENAVNDYRLLQELKPNDFFYSIAIISFYTRHRHFDKAQAEIDLLLLRNPNSERILVSQAILFYELGKYREGLRSSKKVLKKHPESIEGLLIQSKIFIKLKRKSEACETIKKASSKMNLSYFGGERGYYRDFEDDIKSLREKSCN